jgi:MFS family permease
VLSVPRPGLWNNPEFLSLWAGQTISLLGDQVSNLALPLTAAIVLGVSPAEMGLLGALGTLPYLLLGLFAGAMVDRWPRRPVLITADLGRALLLGIIPIAFVLGVLRLEVLFGVALIVGVFNVFFVVAYGAFVPSVVAATDLVEGNSRLALSQQVARVVGPGLAGALVQLLSAPVAIALDALSFLVSAGCLGRIRARDHGSDADGEPGRLLVEIRQGLALAVRDPLLRPILLSVALGNLGDGLVFGSGAFILYATRELGVAPAAVGGIFAGLGIGGIAGAALVGPITVRAGFGRTVVATLLVWAIGVLSLAAVPIQSGSTVTVLTAVFAGVGLVNPIFNTNLVSLVQTVTPRPLLGRITGTSRFITWGVLPIGAALGGQIAEVLGLRAPLLAAGVLSVAAFVLLATSRIRGIASVAAAAELLATRSSRDDCREDAPGDLQAPGSAGGRGRSASGSALPRDTAR